MYGNGTSNWLGLMVTLFTIASGSNSKYQLIVDLLWGHTTMRFFLRFNTMVVCMVLYYHGGNDFKKSRVWKVHLWYCSLPSSVIKIRFSTIYFTKSPFWAKQYHTVPFIFFRILLPESVGDGAHSSVNSFFTSRTRGFFFMVMAMVMNVKNSTFSSSTINCSKRIVFDFFEKVALPYHYHKWLASRKTRDDHSLSS